MSTDESRARTVDPGPQLTVLVAEDDPDIQDLLREILSIHRFRATEAGLLSEIDRVLAKREHGMDPHR